MSQRSEFKSHSGLLSLCCLISVQKLQCSHHLTLCFPLHFITLYDFHIYFTLAIIITIIIERNSQHQIQFPRTIGAWSFSFEIYRISKYLQIELLHTAKFTLHCGLLSEKTVFSLYLFGETCCKLKKGKLLLCSRL